MTPTFDDQITFCDAITEAIVRSSIVLTERNLKTDEMKFLFGWSLQLKVDSKKLVDDFGIAESIADKILINLSSIKKEIKSIIITGWKYEFQWKRGKQKVPSAYVNAYPDS